jgi:predicted amidohydrolase
VRISLVQYSPSWENKQCSKDSINQLLTGIYSNVSLFVFPELTLTGFTMRSKRFAETIDGESVHYFASLASKFNTHIIAGIIEADRDKYFNTMIHLDRTGKLVTRYRKIHPFSFTGENRHYHSGDRSVITTIDGVKFGLSICYDLRFPELYRFYAKERVSIIIDIANWPQERIEHWSALLKARAIENQAFVIGVNRVGKDKANSYPGRSSVFHPFGKKLLSLNDQSMVKIVSISIDEVTETRRKYPFLDDMKLVR